MRKFLSLIVIALMAAGWTTSDAKWIIGERKNASQLQAGDTVVLQFVASEAYSDRYLQVSDDAHADYQLLVAPGMGVGAAAVITFEDGPLDIRTGAPTLYIKMVANNKYIAATYWDWTYGMSLTESVSEAAPWQVLDCGQEIPWYTEGDETFSAWYHEVDSKMDENSVGFSVSPAADSFAYLANWYSSGAIWPITWAYCSGNQWNAYEVTYEKDLRDDLEQLLNSYTSDIEYIGGTDPGFMAQDALNTFQSELESAMALCYNPAATDDELQAAYTSLQEARANMASSMIPMTEGYYYIVNDDENIVNRGVAEKAMYLNEATGTYYYGPFDPNDLKFVYKVEPYEDDKWTVTNYKDNTLLGVAKEFCGSFFPNTDPENYTYLTPWAGTGSWYVQTWNGEILWSLTAYGDPAAADDTSTMLWAYNGKALEDVPHRSWGWRFQRVSDEKMAEFAVVKEQSDRTAELKALVKEANDLYNNLFDYKPDYSDKLITTVSGGATEEPAEDNQLTISTVRKQGVSFADKYEYLIDEDDTTYMQGEGYLRIKLKEPKQYITFVYNTRDPEGRGSNPNWQTWGANERPKLINLYGCNVSGGDSGFGDPIVTGIDMGDLPLPATYTFDFGRPVDRVAFFVTQNTSGGTYFTLSEFQMYEAKPDEASSQYYTTEGMSDRADAMKTQATTSAAIVAENTTTDEDIQALKDAIAAVKELYADTTSLAELIAESEVLLQGVKIGDGMGELSDEALATALRTAIDDARATAFVAPISTAAIIAAETAVSEAKAAFLAGLKTFEVGKWYFITNLDTERMGEAGAADAYCGGNAIYLNSKYPGNAVTKWGLFDQTSMTLNADGNPSAMWQFVPVEGTEYYAIQNLYTGYYLGDYAGDNINLPISEAPVPYDVAYTGNAQFSLTPKTKANAKGWSLWPEGYECDVVCHDPGTPASAWTFVEIIPEEQEAITINDFPMNYIDVMAVPYNVKNIAELNEGVHTYAVKKITQETVTEGEGEEATEVRETTIELYEKNEFAAGEPCIIVLGDLDPAVEFDYTNDLIIPFPTEIVDHSYNCVSNGIVGGLHNTTCGEGVALSFDGKKFEAVGAGGSVFGAQTGVIDLTTYKGEVTDVETAMTLVIRGMSELPKVIEPADVNGDGNKNTADVVAVYTFIEQGAASGFARDAADVNRDGSVNTADVVAIYTAIIGSEGAGSRAFKKQIIRLLNK